MFGVIASLVPLIVGFVWISRSGFDNSLIRDYNIRRKRTKKQVCEFITDLNLNYRTHLNLIEQDDDDDESKTNGLGDTEISSLRNRSWNEVWNEVWNGNWLGVGATLDHFVVSNNIINVVFSATMSLSLELIVLILCELIQVGSEYQGWLFHVVIDTLVMLITCLIPFLIINLTVIQLIRPVANSRFWFSVAIYVCWFILLHKFGDLSLSFTPNSSGYQTRSLLDRKINQISIAGITVTSILSGIGAATSIYRSLPSYIGLVLFKNKSFSNDKKQQVVTENDVNSLVQGYNNTCLLIKKRETELNDYLVASGGTVYNNPNYDAFSNLHSTKNHANFSVNSTPGGSPKKGDGSPKKANRIGGLIHKVQSFASLSQLTDSGESSYQEKEFNQEINSLKSIRDNLYHDLNQALTEFHNHKQMMSNHTVINRIIEYFNVSFTIYCIYRILNIVFFKFPYYYHYRNVDEDISLLSDELDSTKDALAITIAKVIYSIVDLSDSISETQLINQIGFLISGSLFLMSFSNVLMTLKSFGHLFPVLTSLSSPVKNWLKHLVICQLLAVYIISTCLLIRINLPTNLSVQISKILSLSGSSSNSEALITKEIEFVDHWFDLIFIITIIITLILVSIQNMSSQDAWNSYDEELFLEDSGKTFKLS